MALKMNTLRGVSQPRLAMPMRSAIRVRVHAQKHSEVDMSRMLVTGLTVASLVLGSSMPAVASSMAEQEAKRKADLEFLENELEELLEAQTKSKLSAPASAPAVQVSKPAPPSPAPEVKAVPAPAKVVPPPAKTEQPAAAPAPAMKAEPAPAKKAEPAAAPEKAKVVEDDVTKALDSWLEAFSK